MPWTKNQFGNNLTFENSDASIRKLYVERLENASRSLVLAQRGNYEAIKNQLSNTFQNLNYFSSIEGIEIESSNRNELTSFFEKLAEIEPTIADILPEIINNLSSNLIRRPPHVSFYESAFEAAPMPTEMIYYSPELDANPNIQPPQNIDPLQAAIDESFELSTRRAPGVTPISVNQKILDELGELSNEIPEEFLCHLTGLVMTTPVYASSTPDIRFDKDQIMHWLKGNPTNPYNRQPLNPKNLVEDKELKKQINDFIKAEQENKKQTQKKPKPGK